MIMITYYILSTTVFLGHGNWKNKNSAKYYEPHYEIYLISLGGIVVIAVFEELTKRRVRHLFVKDH
jgi:hypothetical protein